MNKKVVVLLCALGAQSLAEAKVVSRAKSPRPAKSDARKAHQEQVARQQHPAQKDLVNALESHLEEVKSDNEKHERAIKEEKEMHYRNMRHHLAPKGHHKDRVNAHAQDLKDLNSKANNNDNHIKELSKKLAEERKTLRNIEKKAGIKARKKAKAPKERVKKVVRNL